MEVSPLALSLAGEMIVEVPDAQSRGRTTENIQCSPDLHFVLSDKLRARVREALTAGHPPSEGCPVFISSAPFFLFEK